MSDQFVIIVEQDAPHVVTFDQEPTNVVVEEESVLVVNVENVGPRGPVGGYAFLDAGGNIDFPRPEVGGPWIWSNVPGKPNNMTPQDLWVDVSG